LAEPAGGEWRENLDVEDSPLVRKMYGLVFSPREHQLSAAEDGRKALEALTASSQRYDLISIPIVLTTVEADTSDLLLEAKALGVAAVVKKPWKPQELRRVVQSVLHGPSV
jgi:CheY-like chemotaxis protein